MRALILVLLALIPALLLALFSAWRIYESEIEHLREQAAALSQLSAADLERTLVEAGRLLGVLAELPQVRSGVSESCSALLSARRRPPSGVYSDRRELAGRAGLLQLPGAGRAAQRQQPAELAAGAARRGRW
jgi:hypothetical protein